MPNRCVVHGCSYRSDVNAGISAHFSPTIKSERDKWLRFVYTHRENFTLGARGFSCAVSGVGHVSIVTRAKNLWSKARFL